MELKNKKILIIGMARSGISAAKILNKLGAYIIMNDIKKEETFEEIINDVKPYVNEFVLGKHIMDFSKIDLVVVSPAVPLTIKPIQEALKNNVEVIGELELAYRILDGEFIAITGTNGKTTTTALTGMIFENANFHNHIVGNIGLPVISKYFDVYDETFLITEVSSFQLETIKKFRPKISAILNITPDHLNRHKTMEEYINAKKKVFMNQGEHDYLVLNYDNNYTKNIGKGLNSINCIYFSRKDIIKNGVYVYGNKIIIDDLGEKIEVCDIKDIKILGSHNIENALAATAISYYSGVSPKIIRKTLKEFSGVEHRIEFVKEKNNVKYYNDSKGTNPEATIKAVEAMITPTILIAGGMDKGSEFDELSSKLDDNEIKVVILFGETKNKIKESINSISKCEVHIVNNLEEAVELSNNLSLPGYSVLLSPACASWDMYESYEHRGNEFKNLVYELDN